MGYSGRLISVVANKPNKLAAVNTPLLDAGACECAGASEKGWRRAVEGTQRRDEVRARGMDGRTKWAREIAEAEARSSDRSHWFLHFTQQNRAALFHTRLKCDHRSFRPLTAPHPPKGYPQPLRTLQTSMLYTRYTLQLHKSNTSLFITLKLRYTT